MSATVLERTKIQAQVLVPLVKALQAELGEARANALVRKTLGDLYRKYGEEFWRSKNEENLGKFMASGFKTFARDDALDYTVVEQTQDALAIMPSDFNGEGFGGDVELTRTRTIMQGADHCDFRYRRVKKQD